MNDLLQNFKESTKDLFVLSCIEYVLQHILMSNSHLSNWVNIVFQKRSYFFCNEEEKIFIPHHSFSSWMELTFLTKKLFYIFIEQKNRLTRNVRRMTEQVMLILIIIIFSGYLLIRKEENWRFSVPIADKHVDLHFSI